MILSRYNIQLGILVIPALRRLRQEDHELQKSLGYITRPCLEKANKQKYCTDLYLPFFIVRSGLVQVYKYHKNVF
jgi:hypothetical protein